MCQNFMVKKLAQVFEEKCVHVTPGYTIWWRPSSLQNQ